MDHVVYFLIAGVTHFQPATFRSSWFTFRLMIVTLPDTLHPFPYALALFSFSIHQFFSSLSLCEPGGFSFSPFFIPPSIFAVLISHSFRSTLYVFSGPFQFILCSLELFYQFCNFFSYSLTMFFFVLHLDLAAHIPFSFLNIIYFSARCKIYFWVSLSP